MDLVHEQKRAPPRFAAVTRFLKHLFQIGDAGENRGNLLEMQVGRLRQQPRDRGLAGTWRSPEHQRTKRSRLQHVGDVLAHAGNRGELVQHAIDVYRLHRGALERGEQNAPQRIAERDAESPFERLGNHRRDPRGVAAGGDLELVRPD